MTDALAVLGAVAVSIGAAVLLFCVGQWVHRGADRGVWKRPMTLNRDGREQRVWFFCLPSLGWRRSWGLVRIRRKFDTKDSAS